MSRTETMKEKAARVGFNYRLFQEIMGYRPDVKTSTIRDIFRKADGSQYSWTQCKNFIKQYREEQAAQSQSKQGQ